MDYKDVDGSSEYEDPNSYDEVAKRFGMKWSRSDDLIWFDKIEELGVWRFVFYERSYGKLCLIDVIDFKKPQFDPKPYLLRLMSTFGVDIACSLAEKYKIHPANFKSS